MAYSFNLYFSDDKVPKIIKKYGSLEDFQKVVKKMAAEMVEHEELEK